MDFIGIKQRLLAKPPFLVIIPTVYFLILIFIKWKLALPIDALWFFVGAMLGIFLLDIAEVYSNVNPSPFRSILFCGALLVLGFYIVTSTNEAIAKGLILSLLLTLVLYQYGEWLVKKNLDTWYALFIGSVPEIVEKIVLVIFTVLFVFESFLFLA
jgi:hypothetical protein